MSSKEKLLALLGITGFLVTAWFVWTGHIDGFDTWVQSGVFRLRTEVLTAFFVPFSYSGNWQSITPVCAMLLLYPKTRKAYGVPVTLAACTSMLFYYSLKYAFARMRPDEYFHLLTQHGYSFPSGHSLTSFLVYGMAAILLTYYAGTGGASLPIYRDDKSAVWHIRSKQRLHVVWFVIVFYIALMGFSRIYVGVHWPSDVIASWFLALPVLVILKNIIRA